MPQAAHSSRKGGSGSSFVNDSCSPGRSAVKRASAKRDQDIDFSLFTDGLKAEREQGITIDVAYRYFSTENRKFIIADCPGHEQYTRNMATGASNCNLAVILIDARYGVIAQTRRHSFICSLLGIKHVVVISKDGFRPQIEEVRFTPGKTKTLDVKLRRL